jgi:hypothetical protein
MPADLVRQGRRRRVERERGGGFHSSAASYPLGLGFPKSSACRSGNIVCAAEDYKTESASIGVWVQLVRTDLAVMRPGSDDRQEEVTKRCPCASCPTSIPRSQITPLDPEPAPLVC